MNAHFFSDAKSKHSGLQKNDLSQYFHTNYRYLKAFTYSADHLIDHKVNWHGNERSDESMHVLVHTMYTLCNTFLLSALQGFPPSR